jgi:hypothetical protein
VRLQFLPAHAGEGRPLDFMGTRRQSPAATEELSAFLLDLYRLARELPLADFQERVLERLGEALPFHGAWWGMARLDRELHSSYPFRMEPGFADYWGRIRDHDLLADSVLRQPCAPVHRSGAPLQAAGHAASVGRLDFQPDRAARLGPGAQFLQPRGACRGGSEGRAACGRATLLLDDPVRVDPVARLDDLVFDVPALIEYCSTFTELVPGDIIVTGTPGGVGAARKPPLWMQPGDVVEVEISDVGVLRNPVAQEG